MITVAAHTFNLIDEPWIPVQQCQGPAQEVSLSQALTQAHTLDSIAADTPTVTAALHRLLLAVLHRALGPPDQAAWKRLWDAETLPEAAITDYLAGWRHRFDLLGSEPFYQCPDLARLTFGTPAALIPSMASGSNVTLFDHTTATTPVALTLAEAARRLVALHAFDLGGMKTPFPGHPKSAKDGPCARSAIILAAGATLRETLLLNLVQYAPDRERPLGTRAQDAPAWESDLPPGSPRQRVPRGWTDWLTWQSRRVLLQISADPDVEPKVTGVAICPGDAPHPAFQPRDVEQQMAYIEAKDGDVTTLRLNPHRTLWRDSMALAVREDHAPRTLEWLYRLDESGAFTLPELVPVLAFGQTANQAKYIAWRAESLPLPPQLLRPGDSPGLEALRSALETAEHIEALLISMARWLRAEFKTDKEIKDEAKKGWRPHQLDTYWTALTPAFDTFVHLLASHQHTHASDLWRQRLHSAATTTFAAVIATAPSGPRSLTVRGRITNTFHHRLREHLNALASGERP
ncbi:type I-E CRISPR-associated protein Cse1/CasA [Actinomadura kijaniata]|uniref:type I-E CRISPR-associated protein Cse1/CasA n=1 Tax=Actinomadura kijaniata TaxID=46161 RepID=UPI00082A79EB|nr:type I-E CRISPR-associated protein Cse1/CasA [Actinomadura kijaniata]